MFFKRKSQPYKKWLKDKRRKNVEIQDKKIARAWVLDWKKRWVYAKLYG